MKLNLGCGAQIPDGWTNVDYALGARLMKNSLFRALNRKMQFFNQDWNNKILIHDLTKRFPWADSSIDSVYSSHTLEHMSKEEGGRFLAECHRVLHRDGVIRIIVPDLRHCVNEYTEGKIPAEDFVEKLGVLTADRGGRLKRILSPMIEFPHKCMYDSARLGEILDDIGFDVSSRSAFDSDIADIRMIEREDRTVNAVIIEGRKR